MGGPEVALEAAGGLDMPGGVLGTDAALIARAIERASVDGGGVLVLMDLGSAVLSAESEAVSAEIMAGGPIAGALRTP
jgi:dihydroxyacetone kinase DhaKLM complex PTS-EIIA-like component DhaM